MSTTPEEDAIRSAAQERTVIELAIPAGLNPHTQSLVEVFARALAEKLFKAEQKYGYSDGWRTDEWIKSGECVRRMLKHVAKGDPRDVAAYCAFLYYHGASTKTDAQESLLRAAAECAALTTMPGHYLQQFESIISVHALVEESHRLRLGYPNGETAKTDTIKAIIWDRYLSAEDIQDEDNAKAAIEEFAYFAKTLESKLDGLNAQIQRLEDENQKLRLSEFVTESTKISTPFQLLEKELEETKEALARANTELANSVSAETFRAGRRDFEHMKEERDKALAEIATLRAKEARK